ncbi:MAG: DNA mismatch repair endonuclease MutL [Oscillibacter sp.]|nr:DNA mismatch repair endonuclease MutL [Oscillibacter sp.]
MAQIEQLSPHVADLIAAGEVVERPASVVKELVENAIDAGASAVAVELRRGGMGLIRVSDNGCGIAPEELPTAFLRHATSKLRRPEDLGSIATLGFRGEALAAIAAVSRVEILSRRRGQDGAASLRLEGGIPGPTEIAGAPEGTAVAVRDLFYNTPARLKFMKKDSAETAAVAGLMQHLALSRPEISFRFSKDGVESLHTPGDGKPESAVYAALGRDFARTLLPVEGRGGDTAVRGFVTRPEAGRGSRSMQVFFVNGRFVKSQLLTAALEEGYRNQLMKGKFPGCVLFVTVPVTAVDVNVHPAKTVVKFQREKEVFDAVYHTVLDSLAAKSGAVQAPRAPEQVSLPRRDFFQTMDAGTFRKRAEQPPARPRTAPDGERRSVTRVADSARASGGGYGMFRPEARQPETAQGPAPVKEPAAGPVSRQADLPPERQTPPPVRREPKPGLEPPAPPEKREERPFVPAIPAVRTGETPGQQVLRPLAEAPWRIAGEVLRTYIVCESEDGCVWLIDKHAAHERMNFDRLKAGTEPVMQQALLTPAAVELGREDAALLLENLPLLERFGFACEDFGEGTVLVREIPADLDAGDAAATLEEFAENLRRGRSLDEKRENLLHTMACKAAIKGGWTSDPAELKVLVEKVQSGEVRFCPHGRPVAVKMTRYELEKMFGRA